MSTEISAVWGFRAAGFGALLNSCVSTEPGEPRYVRTGPPPALVTDCRLSDGWTGAPVVHPADDGRVWFAMVQGETWTANDEEDCIEEARGPWSEGSQAEAHGRNPESLVVTWTDDSGESFRLLQRLSDGRDAESEGLRIGLHALWTQGERVVVVTTVVPHEDADGLRAIRIVESWDRGETWDAPIDVEGVSPEDPGVGYRGGRLSQGGDIELVIDDRLDGEGVLYAARQSEDWAPHYFQDLLVGGAVPTETGLTIVRSNHIEDHFEVSFLDPWTRTLTTTSIPEAQLLPESTEREYRALANTAFDDTFVLLGSYRDTSDLSRCAVTTVAPMSGVPEATTRSYPPGCDLAGPQLVGAAGDLVWSAALYDGDDDDVQSADDVRTAIQWGWLDEGGPWLAEQPQTPLQAMGSVSTSTAIAVQRGAPPLAHVFRRGWYSRIPLE